MIKAYEDLLKPDDTRFDGRSARGPHGAGNPARHLLRELSGVRTHPCLARPRPESRARPHAVPDRRAGGPCPGVPRRPHGACLVQLVSASVVSAMRVSPDGALAGAATRAAPGL